MASITNKLFSFFKSDSRDLAVQSSAANATTVRSPSVSGDVLMEVRRAMWEGDLNRAAILCREVQESQPRNAVANELLRDLRSRFKKVERLYHYVQGHMDKAELFDLDSIARTAAEIYPNHPLHAEIRSRLDSRIERYTRAMQQAGHYLINNQRDLRLEFLKIAQSINPTRDLASTIKAIEACIKADRKKWGRR